MENKYYTPSSKEELHFGMEVEFLNIHPYPPAEPYWFESMIYPYFYEDYEQQIVASIPNDRIRIKYLDQSDIESFGFYGIMSDVFGRQIVNNLQFVKPINDNEWYSIDAKLIEHNRHPIESIVITKTINEKTSIIFDGVIKNRSELKRILKQLNIIE